MKKNLYLIVLCVIVGLFMGTYMFSQYNKDEKTDPVAGGVEGTKSIYAFQYGVYSNKENMLNNVKNIKYSYEFSDDKYYVYVAFTTSDENRDKLKEYFSKKSISVYVKQIDVNMNYYNSLNQYDLLLSEAVTNESINTVLETMLSKFEELALNDKNQRITS